MFEIFQSLTHYKFQKHVGNEVILHLVCDGEVEEGYYLIVDRKERSILANHDIAFDDIKEIAALIDRL